MPLTPLHYSVAYLMGKWKQSLSLPGLIVSSMMPDIERFIFMFISNLHVRGFLHSLFGVATLGTALSVLFTVYAYPVMVSGIFGMDKRMIKEKCRFSKGLITACLGGGTLHVLVDSLHHEYNPTLYPFVNESFDALVLFGNWQLASMIVHSIFFVLLITIFIWEAVKETNGFWKRVLVS
ncbi:DUF4184 family protein [Candidatus Bathyarchaeota archaeon]|nr:DUF4184 family protein [Candidatus Bathyarchaeota archaeon]NIW14191.1 DUF4184 family protein [Candidatus Thorarchaeota archaeon]